jgi:hypothetical protein
VAVRSLPIIAINGRLRQNQRFSECAFFRRSRRSGTSRQDYGSFADPSSAYTSNNQTSDLHPGPSGTPGIFHAIQHIETTEKRDFDQAASVYECFQVIAFSMDPGVGICV